jgi:hypothetical protein
VPKSFTRLTQAFFFTLAQPVRHLFQIFAAEPHPGLHPQRDWHPQNDYERNSMVFIRNYLTGKDRCESTLSGALRKSKAWEELVETLKPHAQEVASILRGTRWVAETLVRNFDFALRDQKESEENPESD